MADKIQKGSKYDPQMAKEIADRDDLAKDPLAKMFPTDRKSALGEADESIKAWHALADDDIAQQRSQDPAPKTLSVIHDAAGVDTPPPKPKPKPKSFRTQP